MNQRELFVISVMVFLTIVAWMLLDIYKVQSELTYDAEFKIGPAVNYRIDAGTLDKLRNMTE